MFTTNNIQHQVQSGVMKNQLPAFTRQCRAQDQEHSIQINPYSSTFAMLNGKQSQQNVNSYAMTANFSNNIFKSNQNSANSDMLKELLKSDNCDNYLSKSNMTQNIRQNTEPKFSLMAHQSNRPPVTSILKCRCGQNFIHNNDYLQHLQLHQIKRRKCNEQFPTTYYLQQNVEQQIRYKMYFCRVCKSKFPNSVLLEKHYDLHVENVILETVIDMEKDYPVDPNRRRQLCQMSNIISFLNSN